MVKCLQTLESETQTTSIDRSVVHPHIPIVTVPQTYLTIVCPCGDEHKIDLNSLSPTTTRTMQVEEKCPYARHFIVHTGHPTYRKIMIVSEFGEK